jgi:hypothetical protein
MNEKETYELWNSRRSATYNAAFVSFVFIAIAFIALNGLEMVVLAWVVAVIWFCVGGSLSAYVWWRHREAFVAYQTALGKSEARAMEEYMQRFPPLYGG